MTTTEEYRFAVAVLIGIIVTLNVAILAGASVAIAYLMH